MRVSNRSAAVLGFHVSCIKAMERCRIFCTSWGWLSRYSTFSHKESKASLSGLWMLLLSFGLLNNIPVCPSFIKYGELPMASLATSIQPFAMLSLATAPQPSFLSLVKRNMLCLRISFNSSSLGLLSKKRTISVTSSFCTNFRVLFSYVPLPYIFNMKRYPFRFNRSAIRIGNSGCFHIKYLEHHISGVIFDVETSGNDATSIFSTRVKYPHL